MVRVKVRGFRATVPLIGERLEVVKPWLYLT